jgi:hypothetical protein
VFLCFVCLCSLSCVPIIVSFSRFSILDCPILSVFLDFPFLIAHSVFSNVYL